MKIETKYDIGDEVWFPVKGMPYKGVIQSLSISVINDNTISIVYIVGDRKNSPFKIGREEPEFFPTKEELLKSL